MKIYNILQNPTEIYNGSHYAITGSGGFEINKKQESIKLSTISQFGKYDVTPSVQLLISSEYLNNNLGIYDAVTDSFENDSIIIDSSYFMQLEIDKIVSVGSFELIYLDFLSFINQYFGGIPYGPELFNVNSQIELNHGAFDKSILYNLLHGDQITGYIQINGINEMLTHMIGQNIFGNRESVYTIESGFLSGDLIYIEDGISISLDINIESNPGALLKTYTAPLFIKIE